MPIITPFWYLDIESFQKKRHKIGTLTGDNEGKSYDQENSRNPLENGGRA
jgi:hypothetical protein